MAGVQLRAARPDDAQGVAALHADSWRRHYRGAYADSFLDADVNSDRLAVWTHRLQGNTYDSGTVIAEADGITVGFIHVMFQASSTWGAVVDNLHVVNGYQRRGVGAQLMEAGARMVIAGQPESGLYLWVLQQNVNAQAFYGSRGGKQVEEALVPPIGGVAGRLNGAPVMLRFAWPDPSVLIAGEI